MLYAFLQNVSPGQLLFVVGFFFVCFLLVLIAILKK